MNLVITWWFYYRREIWYLSYHLASCLDLHRTFPENIFFSTKDGLRNSLRNVLVAVAHHNPEKGYCQVSGSLKRHSVSLIKEQQDTQQHVKQHCFPYCLSRLDYLRATAPCNAVSRLTCTHTQFYNYYNFISADF